VAIVRLGRRSFLCVDPAIPNSNNRFTGIKTPVINNAGQRQYRSDNEPDSDSDIYLLSVDSRTFTYAARQAISFDVDDYTDDRIVFNWMRYLYDMINPTIFSAWKRVAQL
jgi:hypothetical protein